VNQIEKLPQHGKLTAAWIDVGFLFLSSGRAKLLFQALYLPVMGWL
jgi:hypothetical protein